MGAQTSRTIVEGGPYYFGSVFIKDGDDTHDSRSQPPPAPVFRRVVTEYKAMVALYRNQIRFGKPTWRAVVHTDYGHGLISRIRYTGRVQEDKYGGIILPYNFENICPDEPDGQPVPGCSGPSSNTSSSPMAGDSDNDTGEDFDVDVSKGVVIREDLMWSGNRVWFDVSAGRVDVASLA